MKRYHFEEIGPGNFFPPEVKHDGEWIKREDIIEKLTDIIPFLDGWETDTNVLDKMISNVKELLEQLGADDE